MELLHIENLTFRYPGAEKNALDNICLSVPEGSFNVVCGASGCGKTTLLRLMKKELAPFGIKSGKIFYRGTDIASPDANISASDVGFVLQDPESQIVTDTVWHELAFGLENSRVPKEEIRRRTAEIACYFGLDGMYRNKTDTLSGGQKQLLSLVAVTVMRPGLIILDEPTSRLDPIAASGFIDTLVRLNRELGITVIISEHRLEELFPVADRIIALECGRLIADAPPAEAGEFMCSADGSRMLPSLPCSMRFFRGIGGSGQPPVSIRDGRKYLRTLVGGSQTGIRPTVTASAPVKTADTAAELDRVTFRYEKDQGDVLHEAALRVNSGEIFFLLGGNGAGKTTVLRLLSGLDRPYRGKVRIFGKDTGKYGPELYRNCVSYLPQDPKTVFFADTVESDLLLTLDAMGIPADKRQNALDRVCSATGTGEFLGRHPYDLSGGEMQKCALTKVLLSDPRLLLLDEPTKGLDAFSKIRLKKLLCSLRDNGMTVIAVTHDTDFAAECGDRCAMVFDSGILPAGTPSEFFSGNSFYTTAAARISQGIVDRAVTCGELIAACRRRDT